MFTNLFTLSWSQNKIVKVVKIPNAVNQIVMLRSAPCWVVQIWNLAGTFLLCYCSVAMVRKKWWKIRLHSWFFLSTTIYCLANLFSGLVFLLFHLRNKNSNNTFLSHQLNNFCVYCSTVKQSLAMAESLSSDDELWESSKADVNTAATASATGGKG